MLTDAEREVVLADPLTRRFLATLDGDKVERFLEARAVSLRTRSERPPARIKGEPVTGREVLPPVRRR